MLAGVGSAGNQRGSAVRANDVVPADAAPTFDADRLVGSGLWCRWRLRIRVPIRGLGRPGLPSIIIAMHPSCRHWLLPVITRYRRHQPLKKGVPPSDEISV